MWAEAQERRAAAEVVGKPPPQGHVSQQIWVPEVFSEECMNHLWTSASLLSPSPDLAHRHPGLGSSGGRQRRPCLCPGYRLPLTNDPTVATVDAPPSNSKVRVGPQAPSRVSSRLPREVNY